MRPILICTLLVSAIFSLADAGAAEPKLKGSIAASSSTSLTLKQRQAKFFKLVKYREENQTENLYPTSADQLIALLRDEAAAVERGDDPTEEHSEFYADLISEVADLHSLAAADVLMLPVVLKTGGMASRGIAAMGAVMLPTIQARLNDNNDSNYTGGLLLVLDEILSRGGPPDSRLTSADRDSLRTIALQHLSPNFSGGIRAISIRMLAKFSDHEAQNIVMKYANGGPDIPNGARVTARLALGLPLH